MTTSTVWRRVAAVCMAGAAAIHLGVTEAHFQQWWAFGVFFLLLAAAQLTWALFTWIRPDRNLLLLGATGALAVVALWLLTRTVGLPFGPDAGSAEPFGPADVIAAVFEVLAAVSALQAARQPLTGRAVSSGRATAATAAAASLVLVGSGVAMAVPVGHATGDAEHAGGQAGATGHAQTAAGVGERHHLPDLPDVSTATAAQTAAAAGLLAGIETATAKYRDIEVARAAGWDVQEGLARRARRTNGKAKVNSAKAMLNLHVGNKAVLKDGKDIDPAAPNALIYDRSRDGTWSLIGVMFIAEDRKHPTADYAPYLRWHYHDKCRVPGQKQPTDPAADGSCPTGSQPFTGKALMTHVWFVQPDDLRYAFDLKVPRQQVNAYQATLR
ncbi:MAG TPA: hypothetical protein VFJ97_12125 [Dermatophilaceae bacterium]|nr:hypothetical protein [Dermatophilaceae bacterium]